ncbi:hypothetical protein ACOMHN_020610 [Nucella lapillus]
MYVSGTSAQQVSVGVLAPLARPHGSSKSSSCSESIIPIPWPVSHSGSSSGGGGGLLGGLGGNGGGLLLGALFAQIQQALANAAANNNNNNVAPGK